MPNWTCRSCDGGFPKPARMSGTYCCPWCSEPVGKWAGDFQGKMIGEIVEADNAPEPDGVDR